MNIEESYIVYIAFIVYIVSVTVAWRIREKRHALEILKLHKRILDLENQ